MERAFSCSWHASRTVFISLVSFRGRDRRHSMPRMLWIEPFGVDFGIAPNGSRECTFQDKSTKLRSVREVGRLGILEMAAFDGAMLKPSSFCTSTCGTSVLLEDSNVEGRRIPSRG